MRDRPSPRPQGSMWSDSHLTSTAPATSTAIVSVALTKRTAAAVSPCSFPEAAVATAALTGCRRVAS